MKLFSEEYSLEYYPQKIIQWLKSYNIPFQIVEGEKEYPSMIETDVIRKRIFFKMSIENLHPEIEFDNVNECVFLTFLMWNGNNLEFRNEFLKNIEK